MVDNSSEGGRWIVTKSGLGFKGCRTRSGLQGSGRSPIKPICAGVKLDAPAVSDSSNFRLLARAVNSSSNRAISARVPIVFLTTSRQRHLFPVDKDAGCPSAIRLDVSCRSEFLGSRVDCLL